MNRTSNDDLMHNTFEPTCQETGLFDGFGTGI